MLCFLLPLSLHSNLPLKFQLELEQERTIILDLGMTPTGAFSVRTSYKIHIL